MPTPTQPELAEADEAVFDQLTAYTAAKVEYRTVRKPRPKRSEDAEKSVPMGMASGGGVGGPPRGVEVLDEGDIARRASGFRGRCVRRRRSVNGSVFVMRPDTVRPSRSSDISWTWTSCPCRRMPTRSQTASTS